MKAYKIPQICLSYVAEVTSETIRVRMSKDSVDVFRKTFEEGEMDYREYFKVMYLNRANKPIGIQTISMGGTTSTVVDVKIIFSGALLANAQSIVVCHNHPSGNLRPSPQDDALTKKIAEAGRFLDIALMDHIILSSKGYYSYADEGRL